MHEFLEYNLYLLNIQSFAFCNRAAPEYFPFSISNEVNFAMAQQCTCILRVVLVGTRTLGTRNSSTSARRSCCCRALFSPWEHRRRLLKWVAVYTRELSYALERVSQVSPAWQYISLSFLRHFSLHWVFVEKATLSLIHVLCTFENFYVLERNLRQDISYIWI